MEWIIPMIAGIMLDICGVYLILNPFFKNFNNRVYLLNNILDDLVDEQYKIYDEYEKKGRPIMTRPKPSKLTFIKKIFPGFKNEKAYLEHLEKTSPVLKKAYEEFPELKEKDERNSLKSSIIKGEIEIETESFKLSKCGFIFLFSGFTLQLIANLINYYNNPFYSIFP